MIIINISIHDLLNLNNPNIIDIRNTEKYNDNHIPNSINIPFLNLLKDPKKYLNKNEKYYIYCQYGRKSYKLCIILKNLGYNVCNIINGYEGWILEK